MKKHILTIGAVVMALICFVLGSMQGGAIFMALAIWVEVSSVLKMSRKYKPKKENTKP
jgi:VIT1/CCC1 family predicted Fe2+/Mn2+ transporter